MRGLEGLVPVGVCGNFWPEVICPVVPGTEIEPSCVIWAGGVIGLKQWGEGDPSCGDYW